MPKYSYIKRKFLDPPSSLSSAYILAEVAASDNDPKNNVVSRLVLANRGRRAELLFYLHNAQERRRSIRKANILVKTVEGFYQKLIDEAKKIESVTRSRRK